MLRLIASTLAISLCAHAQFFGLATPADGSRVYFATPLRQKNTTQPNWGKLFTFDSTGLNLLVSRDQEVPPSPTVSPVTNPYDIFGASLSADGKVLAIAARRGCPFGECTYRRIEQYATTITSGGQSKDYPGALQLSASGEWAFGNSIFGGLYGPPAYLVNVTSGKQLALDTIVPSQDHLYGLKIATTGRAIADDGTFAYSTYQSVVTIHDTDVRRIATDISPGAPVMDRIGRTIVFEVNGAIRLADPSGPGSTILVDDGFAPTLSDDGRVLVYLANRDKPQIHVYRFGGISRQLGFDTAGISQAIISGDGSTIYAVTLGGRLVKINATTGTAQELIPRTPYVGGGSASLPAPGKLTTIGGVGLTDLSFTADPPLPAKLNGVSVSIAGETALIQSIRPTAITVLVPPDVQPGPNVPLDLTLISPSPFDAPHAEIYVTAYAPEALTLPGTITVVAAHQDWHALVTADDPAAPGEVIHAYAVGLGDTTPSVAYGQPAPTSEPFARLKIPISCADGNPIMGPLEILYEGLAPGLAGVYQLDLRMPSTVTGDFFGLYCVWGGIGSGGPSLFGRIPMTQPSH
jgi:uncharacterized protein (TIGR03437 family)